MRRLIILTSLTLLSPALATADNVEDRINAISARLGIEQALPAMEDTPAPNMHMHMQATPQAETGTTDPLMPMINEYDIPPQRPTGTYKASWQPDYRIRDVEYLGQWITVFVGEGYATPVSFPKSISSIKIVKGEQLGLTKIGRASCRERVCLYV